MDNSEYMRNGDYSPTRFEAQYDAVSMLITAKTNANPESTVGMLTMAGRSVQVIASPTDEQAKLLSSLHGRSLGGKCNIAAALQVAMLALKHRNNKRGGQRIIVFVGSPIDPAEEKGLKKVGKQLKKSNIALDIVSVGANVANQPLLEGLLEAVNKNDNSHYVDVSPGMIPSEVLRKSAIVGGGGNGNSGNVGEFGGMDPNMDPELAMALRISMEEARQANGGNEAPSTGGSGPMDTGGGDDEDALLQQALQMSMTAAMDGESTTAAVNETESLDDDDDEEAALAAAIAMSNNTTEETSLTPATSTNAASEQFSDPNFVNQLLSDLPGVDMNDPQILAALQSLGAGANAASEDAAKKKEEEDKKD
jgi:26S proteasome regulatory subunit N10